MNKMHNENNSSSESLYYSPTNTDSSSDTDSPPYMDIDSPKQKNIIDCNCIKVDDSCLILCFNMNINQFESMNCKIFKSQFK